MKKLQRQVKTRKLNKQPQLTEKRVREIVREELIKWDEERFIPRPMD